MSHLIANISSALLLCSAVTAYSSDILTGEKKLACEATMCLMANGGKPTECTESIRKYLSIKIRNSGSLDPRKTLKARKNFLKLCPTNESEEQRDRTLEALVASNSSDMQERPDECKINRLNQQTDLSLCR